MELIPTPQEALIELYHAQPWEHKDVVRYKNAIKEFEKTFKLQPPYKKSYHSFKNAITKRRRRKLTKS